MVCRYFCLGRFTGGVGIQSATFSEIYIQGVSRVARGGGEWNVTPPPPYFFPPPLTLTVQHV